MTPTEFLHKLNRLADRLGSRQALAEKLGVSASYLSDVLNGNRPPGEKILKPLGLVKIVSYEKKEAK